MKPGRELDQLIAEKIIGAKVTRLKHMQALLNAKDDLIEETTITSTELCSGNVTKKLSKGRLPNYSTNIADVAIVIRKIHEMEIKGKLTKPKDDKKLGLTFKIVYEGYGITETYVDGKTGFELNNGELQRFLQYDIGVKPESIPHAICLAALKAVEVEV